MNLKKMTRQLALCMTVSIVCFSSVHAADVPEANMSAEAKEGMDLFQGKKRFAKGGASCVSCHNVTNDKLLAPGGLFAKDLTDVYGRLGEGITGWLMAPPFPAMAVSYETKPLTENERLSLTAFFKYSSETKDHQKEKSGYTYFIIGGGVGVICLLLLVQVIWNKRKTSMVKDDIFARQKKSFDGKL